jgi:uncharacterized repeat protein (TIGR01451 family)
VSSPLVLTPGDGTGVTVTFMNGDKTKSTSALAATLTGTGYSKAADGCSGVALGPRKSCSVTVTYPGPVPTTQQDAFLTVGAKTGPPSVTSYFTVLPPAADLGIAKSVDNTTPNQGDQVTFTLTVTNNGPSAATSVRAVDQLPAGLTFVSANPSQGTFNTATGVWAAGTVSTTGAPPMLTITTRVDSEAPRTNTATISADQFDPNSANNSASVTVTPRPTADLAITQSVDNATPNVGDQISFTLTLSNNGPGTATSVRAFDQLPAGLPSGSANPSQGSYNPVTGVWAVGSVPSGASATLTIAATVYLPDPVTIRVSCGSNDQFDPNTADNIASATVTPQAGEADLAITQSVDNATPNRGDQITYTLTLTNNGPSAATRVVGLFVLRNGLTFVSANPSQGSYDPATGVWRVTDVSPVTSLASGASATLTVAVTFDSRDPVSTQAAAGSDDQFDPNQLNNDAFLTVTPLGADLAITQSVDNATPNRGDQITYTLTLTNNGPSAATRVRGFLFLHDGLTFLSANPSQGTYDPATGVWTVSGLSPSFASGASATLSVTVTFDSPDPVTTQASANSDDQFDPNQLNNDAFLTVTPQPTV